MLVSPLGQTTNITYIRGVGLPTMAINALVITGPDPGAVPGGSTITVLRWRTCLGPKQDRRTGKEDCFRRGEAPYRLIFRVANDNFAEEVALAA